MSEAPDTVGRAIFGTLWTRTDILLAIAGSTLVTVLLATYIWQVGGWQDRSVLQSAVLAVIVVDLVAGIFTTSTAPASRWYHRPGGTARRFRLAFVVVHVSYFVVPAVLFDTGWAWTVANSALLLGAAVAIEYTPTDRKRTIAVGLTVAAVLVNLIWLPLPATLAWLPVLLFVKVLACFLVPESPNRGCHCDADSGRATA